MADLRLLDPGFPPAGEDAWRALVARTLGDKPFESLAKATVEGLPIAPLYAACEHPARFPPRPFAAAAEVARPSSFLPPYPTKNC